MHSHFKRVPLRDATWWSVPLTSTSDITLGISKNQGFVLMQVEGLFDESPGVGFMNLPSKFKNSLGFHVSGYDCASPFSELNE